MACHTQRPRTHHRFGHLSCLLLALAGAAHAHGARTASEPPQSPPPATDSPAPSATPGFPETAAQRDERMAWWRDARFGMFIHWGLYAIPAGEWKGRGGHAEWIRTTAQIPLDEYDALRPQFNPVKFNAAEWAALARDAGMGYVVITTKHHDGFALFDSAASDFDVMATPFRRDIMRELADATRAAGLRIGWYHSIMDWRHPDYLPRRGWEKDRPVDGADFARFEAFLHAQVRELLTNYGPVGVMWFDGEWEDTWTHEHGQRLDDLVRSLQPAVIVNNRVDKGRDGMAGLTRGEHFRGDFGTPEQEVPHAGLPGVDWESCITMNNHWGFNAADRNWKSSADLVRLLSDVASKGGNLLLNVGPRADGTFPPEAVERLRDIGAWMRAHGQAIYGTVASPVGRPAWGRVTMVRPHMDSPSRTLHLIVFDWPADGVLRLEGVSAQEVHAHRELEVIGAMLGMRAEQRPDGLVLTHEGPLTEAIFPGAPRLVVVEITDPAGVRYVEPATVEGARRFVDATRVTLAPGRVLRDGKPSTTDGEAVVRYTLDGSDPTPSSPRADGPLVIDRSVTLTARTFIDDGAASGAVRVALERVEPAAGIPEPRGGVTGLRGFSMKGAFSRLPDFAALADGVARTPLSWDGRSTLKLPAQTAARLEGFVRITTPGMYEFALTSDDGARLTVAGQVVVDDDGLHEARERGGSVALGAGWHALRIDHFNGPGEAALALRFGPVGGELTQPVLGALRAGAE